MVQLRCLLAVLPALAAAIDPKNTSELSKWGTLPSPDLTTLSDFGSLSNFQWHNFPPNGGPPNTGVIRKYDFVIPRDAKSPDGYPKSLILVNDQYPGPLLEAIWGDIFQICVTHNIVDEGVTLHWHGLSQRGTQWENGVPGVSQCPIAPGKSYTYTFQADQYGTSWYHSVSSFGYNAYQWSTADYCSLGQHYSGQYGDGLFGPMIIHGPKIDSLFYDHDIGPVMLHDYIHDSYYHSTQQQLVPIQNGGPIFFNIDNNLINGKSGLRCSTTDQKSCVPQAGFAKFNFTTGKTHRLRLINSGNADNQKFSIDKHKMVVIANDFVSVIPYETDVVTLGPGQRTDILVRATGRATDSVWIHSELDLQCANTTLTNPHGLAAIYYPSADTTKPPQNLQFPSYSYDNCQNDPLWRTIPLFPSPPPLRPATTETVNITVEYNSSGIIQLYMNGSGFVTDYNDPILPAASKGQTEWPRARNIYDFGSNSSVRMILINNATLPHPMHLHGHNFWILAEGYGVWDGRIANPINPPWRDTHILRPQTFNQGNSYVVIEWMQDNPGVWPLHCHLSGHSSVGLWLNVLEQRESFQKNMQIPDALAQVCQDWQTWTESNTVDQIDAGV